MGAFFIDLMDNREPLKVFEHRGEINKTILQEDVSGNAGEDGLQGRLQVCIQSGG